MGIIRNLASRATDSLVLETTVATEGQTYFPYSSTKSNFNNFLIYINGILLSNTGDYTSNSLGVTLTLAANSSDIITIGILNNVFSKGEKGEKVSSALYTDANNTIVFTNTDSTVFPVTGVKGQKGDQGSKGADGNVYAAGAKGDKGDKGEVGPTGSTGSTGAKGDKGSQLYAATYIDALNTITFTNSDLTTFSAAGMKGQKGEAGNKGEAGTNGTNGTKGDAGVTSYTTNIGDGTNTSFTINHNLAKADVSVVVFENATNNQVYPDVSVTNNNSCTVSFVTAPTSSQYRVRVLGY
jgi:hypothetical protein